jgi:hypothetical protein
LPFGCAYFGDDYALDAATHRYFMFGSQLLSDGTCSSQAYVTAVDTTTGAVLSQVALSGFIENMQFDPTTGKLVGIQGGINPVPFVALDPSTGTVATVASLPFGCAEFGDDYALDAATHRYFMFGSQLLSDGTCSSQLYVTAVDTTTGAVLSQVALSGYIQNMQFDANLSLTSVTSAPNPSTFGEMVTITATVSPAGSPAPTGTVSFTSNGAGISGCASIPLSSSLTAMCMTSTLAVGTDAIVATYSGDVNYDGSSGMLSQLVNPLPVALQFTPLTPCRIVDTRNPNGTFGGPAISGNSFRSFPLSQSGNPCSIPSSAIAYSLNVTVVPQTTLGYLTVWPTGEGQPLVSTMNSTDGRIKANAAVVPAGYEGAVSVFVTHTTDVILDIDGYFTTPSQQTLQFYPLPPCRVADTRNQNGDLGGPYLQAGVPRNFPVLEATSCFPSGVTPAAYSFNFTAVPHGPLNYLTVWPAGQSQPNVSTLNAPTGTVTANAAIVPAGSGGEISTFAYNDTDLLIDVNGYFAPPGQGGLSLYPLAPCRVLDTRSGNGAFNGALNPPVDVLGSPCGVPSQSQAYVFNATVVPVGSLGYLTFWPDGQQQPGVSTLNAYDGAITSNMAIVPAGNNGKIDAFAYGTTNLILDISSYFAP